MNQTADTRDNLIKIFTSGRYTINHFLVAQKALNEEAMTCVANMPYSACNNQSYVTPDGECYYIFFYRIIHDINMVVPVPGGPLVEWYNYGRYGNEITDESESEKSGSESGSEECDCECDCED